MTKYIINNLYILIGIILGIAIGFGIWYSPQLNSKITCKNFKTQLEAQYFYGQNPAKYTNLDGDNDGIVCEALPDM